MNLRPIWEKYGQGGGLIQLLTAKRDTDPEKIAELRRRLSEVRQRQINGLEALMPLFEEAFQCAVALNEGRQLATDLDDYLAQHEGSRDGLAAAETGGPDPLDRLLPMTIRNGISRLAPPDNRGSPFLCQYAARIVFFVSYTFEGM